MTSPKNTIDEAILSVMGPRFQKVAMIIIKTQEALEAQSIVVELETIGARIEALAEKGRLEGVGNLSRWRHSEVRLPPDA